MQFNEIFFAQRCLSSESAVKFKRNLLTFMCVPL